MKSINLVREFHAAFGQPDNVGISDAAVNELRLKLLREEVEELADALAAGDPVEVLDALTDIQYVLDGAYLQLGFAHVKDAALREVHRSNMTKLGLDGQPVRRADGKIIKGPNYSPPDLAPLVSQTASRSHPQATAAEAGPAGGETGPRICTHADSYGSAVDYGVCLLCGRHTGRIDAPAITRTPAVELGEEES